MFSSPQYLHAPPLRPRPSAWIGLMVALVGWLALSPVAFGQLDMGAIDAATRELANEDATSGEASTSETNTRRRGANPVSAELAWRDAAVAPGQAAVLAVVVNVEPPYHINPNKAQIPANFDFLIPTTLSVSGLPEGVTVGPTQYPPGHDLEVNLTGTPEVIPVWEGQTVLYLPIQVDASVAADSYPLTVSLNSQACDPRVCLPPQTQQLAGMLTVGQASADASAGDPALFADYVEGGGATAGNLAAAPAGGVQFDLFGLGFELSPVGVIGLVGLLLVAALGGFLLNLTPCVLPVIPLKIMGLSRSADNRRQCFLLGLSMTAGVLAFWLLLGVLIASISGFTATNQLFQYPLFTIGVGLVIAIMAVGMCGLFAVQLPQFVYRYSPKHDSHGGSFGFGVMTAVLSTPCTAPFMGAAAAWAATQTPALTLTVFAAIGLGMATPYLVLAAFPQLVERMPRSGPASELIKQVMGLLMLSAAMYFIGVGLSGALVTPPDPPSNLYWWPVGGFIAAAGVWLIVRTIQITPSTGRRVAFGTLGAVFCIAGGALVWQMTDRGPVNWVYYTPERLDQALAEGDVVVMDFTAEWCLNCKALEHSVLYDARVAEVLADPSVTPMKVDLTGNNTEGNAMLSRVDRLTIPLLVVFDPEGGEVFKSDFYTVQQVLTAVEEARQTNTTAAR